MPQDSTKSKDIAIRMASLILIAQDFDIVQDLRELNGRPSSPLYDWFGVYCSRSSSRVHVSTTAVTVSAPNRWLHSNFALLHSMHALNVPCVFCIAGNVRFMPVAISARDLRELVVERLELQHPDGLIAVGIKIPSGSWILYQLAPKHPLDAVSLHYKGKADVKKKVHLRTLRAHHVDLHYCAALKKYIKHMGVLATTVIESHTPESREPACVSFYSLDDKAKVCSLTVRNFIGF